MNWLSPSLTPVCLCGVMLLASCSSSAPRALEEAQQIDSIEAYQDYLRRFPIQPDNEKVHHRIKRKMLEQAIAEGNLDNLRQLTQGSTYSSNNAVQHSAARELGRLRASELVASGRFDLGPGLLESIFDERIPGQYDVAFALLRTETLNYLKTHGNSAKVRAFIDDYNIGFDYFDPTSEASQARDLLQLFELEELDAGGTLEDYREFLKKYPKGNYVAKANAAIAQLEAVEAAKLVETVDVSGVDKWGGTPLHAASAAGKHVHVRAMIAKDADIDATTPRRLMTPLHVAAMRDQHLVVVALVEAGANINAQNANMSYPRDLSTRGELTETYLAQQGGKRNKVSHLPITGNPPGGYPHSAMAKNIIVRSDERGTAYFYNPYGRSPYLATSTSRLVFDTLYRTWREIPAEQDPYRP